MAAKLQQDLDRNFLLVRTWSRSDLNNPEFHAAIRNLLSVIQAILKTKTKIDPETELVSVTSVLIENPGLSPDMAVLVGKIDRICRAHFWETKTVEVLLDETEKVADEFQRICYLFGIIDCLSPVTAQDEIVIHIGNIIVSLLKIYNDRYFHKMKLLLSWLLHIKSVSHNLSFESSMRRVRLLMPNSELLSLLNLHWETTITGTSDLANQCLTVICQIWVNFHPETQYPDILCKMTLSNLMWKSKTKYLILAALVPFIHFCDVLCEYPDTIMAMAGSLSSNYLLSAGTTLFKVLAKSLKAEDWNCCCENVLWDALNSSDKTVRRNAIQHWLPSIVHVSSDVYQRLKKRLVDSEEAFNWQAYVALLKYSPSELEDVDMMIVAKALTHGDDDVRNQAFANLCYSKKKTDPVSEQHWQLITSFIIDNLHCDNPQFRQNMQANVKQFLLRVLDNSLSHVKTKAPRNQQEPDSELKRNIQQIQELHDKMVTNLRRGSSYQRKIATLGVLHYILKLFGSCDSQVGNVTKGASVEKRAALIATARSQNYWHFDDETSRRRYLICLMDDVDDVQDKASEILREFFRPAPDFVQICWQRALRLCDSLKFQRSQCGAKMVQMVAFWCRQSAAGPAGGTWTQLSTLQDASDFLLREIHLRMVALRDNFLDAAGRTPMHGFLGALRRVFQVFDDSRLPSYSHVIALCQSVCGFMLEILSRRARGGPEVAPSFEEMSESIDDVVRQFTTAEGCPDSSVSTSVQHQLVLACAWLNLKESAFLAVEVAFCLLRDETQSIEERAVQIEECANVVGRLLLLCRHKGAIEAAGEAMASLCRRLLVHQDTIFRSIPCKILSAFLSRLEQRFVGASITRKSAGMALFVDKIVASEPQKTERSLVAMTVKRLLAVARTPVDQSQNATWNDLPQSIALHILKSLIHDASLCGSMQAFMEPVVEVAISSFAHPQWSIRNAALQLYGAVVPRLAGNTKNRDSPCGSPTTAEVFHKFPRLANLFLATLDQQKSGTAVSGGLIPTLSLLCRLSPCADELINSKFKPHLTALLNHSVVQVRILAAQTLLAFVPLLKTKVTVINLCEDAQILAFRRGEALNVCSSQGENFSPANGLHGCLTALAEFLQRCKMVALSVEDWELIRTSVAALSRIERQHPCFYVKLAVLKLFEALAVPSQYDDQIQEYIEDVKKRSLYETVPGFAAWIRLKTELILNFYPLNRILPAVGEALAICNGLDVVESALVVLTKRVVKLSNSSVVANTVTTYVASFIYYNSYPSLLPVCLEFVWQRGASALLLHDGCLSWFLTFAIDQCIELRQFGTSTAVLAITTTAVVLKESIEKSLMENTSPFVVKLSRLLVSASQPTEAVAFRQAAAQSLTSSGRVWLEQLSSSGPELSRNLFLIILNLVHDEEKDVRSETALFLTNLTSKSEPQNRPSIDVVCSSSCLKSLADQIDTWFQPHHLVPVIFDLLRFSPAPESAKQSGGPSHHFFEPEAANFYCEEGEMADFFVAIVSVLAKRIQPETLSVNADQLVADARHLLQNIRSMHQNDGGFAVAESVEFQSNLIKLSAQLRIARLCFPHFEERWRELETQTAELFIAL